jgi:hypothetical protein
MLNFVYLRSSRLNFFAFLDWFMHFQQGGEVWACFGLLNAFRRFSGGFEPFLGSGVHRSDRLRSPVWPIRVLVLFTCCALVWLVVSTGLSWADAAALFSSSGFHAFVQGEFHWFRGSLHVCRGSSLWFFRALVWWFACFACVQRELWFCLWCVELLPLPKGSETCLLQVIFLFAFVWLSIACWSFLFIRIFSFSFLSVYYMCVVNALINREIEDHVWFEDRWMVASWCDEWLTTLCRLILG